MDSFPETNNDPTFERVQGHSHHMERHRRDNVNNSFSLLLILYGERLEMSHCSLSPVSHLTNQMGWAFRADTGNFVIKSSLRAHQLKCNNFTTVNPLC